MRLLYMAILDQSLNPADISAHISNSSLLLSTTIYLHRYPSPSSTMPIDLSNLSAEDIAATTAAVEASRRAREERKSQEVEERRK
jgi:hypothetical protein